MKKLRANQFEKKKVSSQYSELKLNEEKDIN